MLSTLVATPEANPLPQRRLTLLAAAALLGLISLMTALVVGKQPGVMAWEQALFGMAGLLLLLTAGLLALRRLSFAATAAITLGATGGLLLLRLALIFIDGTFANSRHGMFMPVYAYYSVIYLLLVLLLPYRQSVRFGVAAWLALALITTLGLLPHWYDDPPRPYLQATLIYVWLGHGLFLTLLFGWARQQNLLLDAHRALADREQSGREAMALSELRFRGVFNQVAAGVGLFDANGRWCEVNARLCELLGYPAEELIGQPMTGVTPAEDHPAFMTRMNAMMSGPVPDYSVERRAIRKDGQVIWLQAQMRRLHTPPGQPTQGVLLAIDISERKRAEQESLEHQRAREFHVDNSPLAVIDWTPDFRVKRWSRHAEQMFGYAEAEVLGRSPTDWRFIHDDDQTLASDVIAQLLGGHTPNIRVICRHYHRDGHVVWCQWHNSVLYNTACEVQSIHSMGADISNEQNMLVALRDSQVRFQAIFAQAAVGMSLLNADGSWKTVNQRLCEITGYAREELLTIDYQTITLPDDLGLDLERARQLIGGEIENYSIEKRFIHRAGHVIWVKVYASRIAPTDTEPALYVAVVEDISERKRAEAEVQKLAEDLEHKVADRTRQLQQTMRNWARRNQELRVLGDMMAILPAALDIAEASRIIETYLPRLFGRWGGAVWIEERVPVGLALLARWGCVPEAPVTLASDDCWAIRRGQALRVEDPQDPLLCPHLLATHEVLAQRPHACVPIVALGTTIGMIHLEWSEKLNAEEAPPDPVLVTNVAEQIGMAIGNVRLREELRRQAVRDPLTSLYNRRHFDEMLKVRSAEHDRSGRCFSLLMIDIDHFKRINDEHGHETGDQVLCDIAYLLQRTLRADEFAFRIGGEEFVLIINDHTLSEAAACAERLRRDVEALEIIPRGGKPLAITVSIGIASYPDDVVDSSGLLQRADTALYAAKRTGRNRVCHAGTGAAPLISPRATRIAGVMPSIGH